MGNDVIRWKSNSGKMLTMMHPAVVVSISAASRFIRLPVQTKERTPRLDVLAGRVATTTQQCHNVLFGFPQHLNSLKVHVLGYIVSKILLSFSQPAQSNCFDFDRSV